MKNNFKLWAMALLAGGMMASCSTEDVTGSGTGSNKADVAYLTVNIMDASGSGTRAGNYSAGSDAENEVTKARFYFYDASGAPVAIDGSRNWIEKTLSGDSKENEGTDKNVERIYKAELILNPSTGELPARMITILNSDAAPGNGTHDTQAAYTGQTKGNFVMSSTVYLGHTDGDKLLEEGNKKLFDTSEAAKKSPIDVYVERVLAKVKISISNNMKPVTGKTDTYQLKNAEGGDITNRFVKINGWTICNQTSQSYLLKHLATAWDATTPWNGWNNGGDYRCFWAQIPTGVKRNNTLGWEDINSTANNTFYIQENTPVAETYKEGDLSTLVVSTTLVDENGNPVERAMYAGKNYVGASEVAKAILTNKPIYYIKTAENTYTKLTDEFYKFVAPESTAENRYTATLVLNTNADGKVTNGTATAIDDEFYTVTGGTGEGTVTTAEEATGITVASINETLAKEEAEIWKNGQCYYSVVIPHLAASGLGSVGVVRNHVYDLTITGFTGYGTPVLDPDKVIIPENPNPKKAYLAAQVKILAWKIVNKDVVLQ